MNKWIQIIVAILMLTYIPATSWGKDLQTLPTKAVAEALEKADWVVVDTRLNDAFNGWKLDGVARGGHITGAVDFSANWLTADAEDLSTLLEEALVTKGITPEKNIVLYDANGKDARAVAEYLQKKGYNNLHLYDVKQWAADTSLPLTAFPKFQQLVPAVILHDIVNGKTPETVSADKKIIIVEASWGEEKTSYAKGHIPGAFHINTDRIEPPTTTEPVMWMLGDDATLEKVVLASGITAQDTVIVTSAEPLAAFRVATVFRYLGVDDVRVLNGGTAAWTKAGFALETARHDPVAVASFGKKIPANPGVIDTMEETRKGLATPESFTLVDNRTWKEHIGEDSGYSYHKIKGRIPGAIFGYAGKKNSYAMDYFRNPDKTMRNPAEFLALWKKQGIDTNKHLSFMCGSGWRVAEIYYYADTIGLKDIGIFSDGWIGWSNAGNPIIVGAPE